ncbi:MAG: hypothetical protein FJY75_02585 [Candidatus Eisenbacteria bacterium]|uniref:Uncharacterized protein n=1 Tax=Eiseniibacteriota bacterium TaxID=2212470 RepID=A0A937X9K5_UNCEI|nr:hypothetical protein [Candidatus Eisenbacteria bacterium]
MRQSSWMTLLSPHARGARRLAGDLCGLPALRGLHALRGLRALLGLRAPCGLRALYGLRAPCGVRAPYGLRALRGLPALLGAPALLAAAILAAGGATAASGAGVDDARPAGGAAAVEAAGGRAAGASTVAAEGATPPAPADSLVVSAYYFHRTFRCETCLRMEDVVAGILAADFAADLARGRLLWLPLDYEDDANAPLYAGFALEDGPALVLSRRNGRREADWFELKDIWEMMGRGEELEAYLRERIRRALEPPSSSGVGEAESTKAEAQAEAQAEAAAEGTGSP